MPLRLPPRLPVAIEAIEGEAAMNEFLRFSRAFLDGVPTDQLTSGERVRRAGGGLLTRRGRRATFFKSLYKES